MLISPAAASVSPATIGNNVSFLVARKVMDAAKMQGDAALALLEQAAQIAKNPPQVDDAGHVDVRA